MRRIIKIDESICNGCGECVTACAEGAIEIKNGKARVVSDSFCDGLGACLGVCPLGALTIEEREAEEFDEKAAVAHLRPTRPAKPLSEPGHECSNESPDALAPCSAPIEKHKIIKKGEPGENELCGWPIQMRLVRPWAPYLKGAHLLVAGDCTAFAYPAIQQNFIRGRTVLVGCPKLDETGPFVDKLAEILKSNEIKDITVLYMTVPCCAILQSMVAEAVQKSGTIVPQKSYVVGIDGKLIE